MKLILLAISAAVSVASVSPAMAQDDTGLAPATTWTLDYDTDSCALRRMFGEGDEQAYLEFRRFEPGRELQTIIASSHMKVKLPIEFKYRFSDDAEWRDAMVANSVTMDSGFTGVLFVSSLVDLPEYEALEDPLQRIAYLQARDLRAMEKDVAARTVSITLRNAFRKEFTLRLGSLDQPMAALNACVDELMTHWGIDVEAHKSLRRPAVPTNLPDVPRMMDYPPKMLRKFMPGVVNVRLEIDDKGLITACHIQMPLSDPAFEASSCADIQHALEFEPALDKDGKPIASYWVTRVVFQLAR